MGGWGDGRDGGMERLEGWRNGRMEGEEMEGGEIDRKSVV